MRKFVLFLFVLLSILGKINAQFADPSVSGALYTPSEINVTTNGELQFNFINTGFTPIPNGSVEITVSAPFAYYNFMPSSTPTGLGASAFDWDFYPPNTWKGINNSEIPATLGGLITIEVKGEDISVGPEVTNINIQVVTLFNSFSDNSGNNNLQPALKVNAAPSLALPTPHIIGDFFGCKNTNVTVQVDTFVATNTYTWQVTGGATIINSSNGQATIKLPDTNTGTFTVIVEETAPGGETGVDQQIISIEEGRALVCDDDVHISLDENCTLDIQADVILEGYKYPNESYSVVVRDNRGNIVPSNVSGPNYIGKKFEVKITHTCSGNSCWGYVTLEDKIAPVIDCPDPITVSCFDESNFAAPTATDNCDTNVPVTEISNVLDAADCNQDFAAQRTITYQAKDDWGNVSELCIRTIYYKFENIEDVVFPDNKDDVEDPAYTCDGDPVWDINGNGYPDIEESGYPTLNGERLLTNNGLCKINSVFTDQRIDICESSFKIIRTWTILDWCSGAIVTGNQIIKVLDRDGPAVVGGVDFDLKFYTRPYECVADVTLPDPEVIFDCSTWDYTVAYLLAGDNGLPPVNGEYITDNVDTTADGQYIIRDLPKGLTWVRYRVTDACGNTTDSFTEVYVEDNVPPVAVCDENTVVSLTNAGYAQIYANTFDDGSSDNCGGVYFEVARMTAGCGENTQFKPAVIFCCDDITNNDLMVQLRVWDDANCNGIYGDDVNVYYDSNGNGILGDVVNGVADRIIRRVSDNSNTCMVRVKVQDKAPPIVTCPPNITVGCHESTDTSRTGAATAVDNCTSITWQITTTGSVDQCKIGTLNRTFRATDRANNIASCTQRITVIDPTPFKASDIDWTKVPNRTLTGCKDSDISPDVLGRPTWRNDECSLVASSYEDQTFTFVDSVCQKILRTWTIIDWCTFDENNPQNGGKYEYIQEIKINNTVAPQFTSCRDITACIDGANCSGFVELLHPATDDCTKPADLRYIYTIDRGDNGTIDRSGGSFDASGIFEPDVYRVKIEVSDGCNNREDCSYKLTINDCKKPTPYCYSELVTVIMNSPDETVAIWARDFDKESFDNCPGELRYSFSANVQDTGRVFTCDDLGVQTLEMWVTDAAGNNDFCQIRVNVQANGTVCEGTTRVAGKVVSQTNTPMKNVALQLKNLTSGLSTQTITDTTGTYQFYGVNENTNYEVSASKNIDIMNGVSTLDLVHIQRHILGITKLDSPYKIIAADINGTKTITAADLVALRKVILGLEMEFPNNQSWRFLDKDQTFANHNAPWPFTEILEINGADLTTKTFDFMGVKIGDVNNSAKANARESLVEPRSSNPMEWFVDEFAYEDGALLKVEIKAGKDYILYGFQNTLAFNANVLEFVGLEAGKMNITDANFAMHHAEGGLIPMSFSQEQPQEVQEGDVLFTIFFNAKASGNSKDILSITDKLIQSEVYDYAMEPQQIKVSSRVAKISDITFTVAQNSPNPFTNYTKIDFEIGVDDIVAFKIFDINGKLLFNDKASYKAGIHTITIDNKQLPAVGVLTYVVESSLGVVTKKMVKLE